MRRSRTDLRARVNGDLPLEFADVALTSYAGLELFGQYLASDPLQCHGPRGVCRVGGVGRLRRDGDGAPGGRAAQGAGGRRLRHLTYVKDDPLFQRFCEIQVVPTARTVGEPLPGWRWRSQLGVACRIDQPWWAHAARLADADLDDRCRRGRRVDEGPAGRTRLPGIQSATPEGAELLPDHGASGRNDPRAAREESVGQRARQGKAGLPFLRDLGTQLGTLLPHGGPVRFRMDGAFFRQDVLQWLEARDTGYAIKVPFYGWLNLQQYIRAQPTWRPVTPDITGFVVPAAATPWGRSVWVAIYRKHVRHPATKNYQLDLFDPNDGHYEYPPE